VNEKTAFYRVRHTSRAIVRYMVVRELSAIGRSERLRAVRNPWLRRLRSRLRRSFLGAHRAYLANSLSTELQRHS